MSAALLQHTDNTYYANDKGSNSADCFLTITQNKLKVKR